MQSSEPSIPRVAAILARMSLRRTLNRFSGAKLFRKKSAERQANARKRSGSVVLPTFLGIVMCAQAFFISLEVLRKMENIARVSDGAVELAPAIYNVFRNDETRRLASLGDDEDRLRENLEQFLTYQPANVLKGRSVDELMALYRERGVDAFVIGKGGEFGFQSMDRKLDPEAAWMPVFSNLIAAILVILFLNVVFTGLGPANNDLGKVEWSFEWLFTFPLPTRGLFTARLLDYTLTNFYGWILFTCFLSAMYVRLGWGWWTALLAPLSALFLNLIAAAFRISLETWLRLRLPPTQVKNLQALFSILALVSLFFVFAVGIAETMPSWISGDFLRQPFWQWIVPASIPAFAFHGGVGAWVVPGLGVVALVIGASAVGWTSRQVRFGLVAAPNAYQGSRVGVGDARSASGGRSLFRGILKKDLLLICRDRNLFASIFIIPLFFVGIQLVLNSGMFVAAERSANHSATIAFGIGAYVLLTGGLNLLASEGAALWVLYTLPERLSTLMRRKLVVMTAVSFIYVALMLVYLGARSVSWGAEAISACLMALVGVVIYGFISGGIGVLSFDPLAQEHGRKRVKISSIYGYMMLATMYAYGIYTPVAMQKIATIVMASFLAFAIWQKVDERLPYLLDPTEEPPPRLSLSFAMAAAFAFFILQGLAILVIMTARKTTADVFDFNTAFSVSGAVVVFVCCIVCMVRRIPNWWVEIGFTSEKRGALAQSIPIGIVTGLTAAVVAWGYLTVIDAVPALRVLKEEMRQPEFFANSRWGLAILVIVAAPVFEEFIFRGLLFRSLCRTLSVGWSVVASAAIFAVVHPALSVVPVFGLGVLAAISLRKTGLLLAPIIAHAVYNSVVLFALQ